MKRIIAGRSGGYDSFIVTRNLVPDGRGGFEERNIYGETSILTVSQATRQHEREVMNTHKVLAGPSWRETVRIVNA